MSDLEPRQMLDYARFGPTPQMVTYLDKIADLVRKHGIAVQAVFGSETESSFAYTVGLAALGHPEVLVAGLPQEVSHWLLNTVHQQVKDGTGSLEVGYVWHGLLQGDYLLEVCATTPEVETGVARRLYGDDVPVVQLVWQDKNGHFPWELDYELSPELQKHWFVGPEV